MSIMNTSTSYGSVSKFFHWLIAILVIGMLCIGYLMGYIKDDVTFGTVISVHKITGLFILVLIILRLIWTLFNPKPALPSLSPLERFAAKSVHFLFYIILIVMPVAGWIMSVASGHVPHLFSWAINLPIEKSKPTAELWESVHNTLAIVIIVFVSLHILAALYHRLVKKDDVLQRML